MRGQVQIGTQDKLDQLNVLRQNPHFAEFIDQCHETSNVSNPARKKTLEEVLMTPLFYLAQVAHTAHRHQHSQRHKAHSVVHALLEAVWHRCRLV